MNPIVSFGNKLKYKFENVKDLNKEGVFSDKFHVDKIDWKIKIFTTTEKKVKHLSIQIHYDSQNKDEKNWICETKRTVKLLNQNERGEDACETSSSCIDANRQFISYPTFLKWTHVVSSGFIKNDSIIVEVDLSFKYYDFSRNIPNFTDITLEVEDTKFFFNRGVLCSRSKYFQNLFINEMSKTRVINMENVKIEDFRYFMASFCLFFETIEAENYENLIKMATVYGVPELQKNCEKFLMTKTDLQLVEKLKYADTHNYNELMKTCIDSLKTTQEIKQLKKSVEFENFKESTKLSIMMRLSELV